MKKAIVIGAGPAGLTAAYELLKNGGGEYGVTVLEASGTVGGISRTVRVGDNRMDIGGHRFFSKDARVTKWWNDMMPLQGKPSFDDKLLGREKALSPGGPDPEKTDRVMLLRQRISRIYYNRRFFDYPISLKPETIRNMGFLTTAEAGFSYIGAAIHKRQETNLENFYINRFGKKLYSMFFEGYTEKLWGRHPRDISADWGAQRVKGLSITAVLKDVLSRIGGRRDSAKVETSLIEEFRYPKYGPGQLWEITASGIEEMGGRVIMNTEVTGINTDGEGRIVSVRTISDGAEITFDGDVFISSMPLKDLIAGMNGVPDDIVKIAEGLPYRDFVTVGLLLDRLNLKNETDIKTLGNIVPDCWIYVQDEGIIPGRIQIFNNWSPYLVGDPQNKVWIGLEFFCAEGDGFWNMSEEDCVSLAADELVKMGIINGKGNVLASHREKVRKAYPAYFDTYSQIDELIKYLDRYSNLYCIGRNGQHRYNNMDHSMCTAFEAVGNILSGREDKSNIWSVNTEQEYHEEAENA
ncbi:MAG: NAD(P)/FAD-dependent oxidoreductase [Clostridia bacterium]|nr:NAD(P)/FAD-dependent oxidoreductase [Clostridia bacterium]